MKDAGFRIRVQSELRRRFLDACRAEDRPAAQVMREFMRDYVARRSNEAAGDQPEGEVESADPLHRSAA
jgi:hypothetical protein